MAGFGRPARDLSSEVFDRLTVIKRAGSTKTHKALWLCQCSCGKRCVKIGTRLISRETKSCGCLKAESPWNTTHGHASGGRNTRVYAIWLNMKYRCDVKHGPRFKDYGGRGITYEERWSSFENFLDDMGQPPAGMSLDRIDNNGPYSKANCRWTDKKTQRQNSRGKVTWVEIKGKRMTLTEAVRKHGKVGYLATLLRIGHGWEPLDAVLTAPYGRNPKA